MPRFVSCRSVASRPILQGPVTPHFGVQRTLGLDLKVRYTSHRTLGSNALWDQNWEIDLKAHKYATYQRTLVARVLKVSSEFCLNTEYWLIFDLRHWNILGRVQDDGWYFVWCFTDKSLINFTIWNIWKLCPYNMVLYYINCEWIPKIKRCCEKYHVLSVIFLITFGAILCPILKMKVLH
jgi:hypothetical protein